MARCFDPVGSSLENPGKRRPVVYAKSKNNQSISPLSYYMKNIAVPDTESTFAEIWI